MKRPTVDPAWIFGLSLLLSLVLWYPSLRLVMHGQLDITTAGMRYFLALAGSWAGVFMVCSIVAMYASQPRRPRPPAATNHPGRRRDDAPAEAQDAA
ncbi:MAG TPA: hypothetical protein VFR41_15000 [Acidimicrobiia bacterium]|nr:hypothetical protein [Acidimicrobiia bacterium]